MLDEVSTKMTAYKNMFIDFSQTLVNEDAGIKYGDEPPIRGEIVIAGEKYQLEYLGNTFLFDGKNLFSIAFVIEGIPLIQLKSAIGLNKGYFSFFSV